MYGSGGWVRSIAIAIALPGLGHSVTPNFLFKIRFYSQLNGLIAAA